MKQTHSMEPHDDTFDLRRFVDGQEGIYEQALAEVRRGQKRSHWMWFIFPQLDGLGRSSTAKYYGLKGIEEARHFLQHPILGRRLLECSEAVLAVEGRTVSQMFGSPDDMKLHSSMTLFAQVAEPGSVFVHVLEKYFNGEADGATLRILGM